jgi:hypothetical protein
MVELIDELIDELSASGLSLDQIRYALEDGKWLAMAGIPQERAEFLHAEVIKRLRGVQYVSH